MNKNIDAAKEAVRQLSKSKLFIFGAPSEMTCLTGFYGLLLRQDRDYYSVECFVREKENRVVIRLYLPLSCGEDRLEYVSDYLECVNKSQKVNSRFDIGADQTIEVCRRIGYEKYTLTVGDLERALAEMIIDAEIFFPVIDAIGLDKPIPSDLEEPPWVFLFVINALGLRKLPCDIKEPSRLYFEEYSKSQRDIEEKKKLLRSEAGLTAFTETNQAGQEETEEEHFTELGSGNLGFCGTLKDKKRPSRFDDTEFREKFFHLMYEEELE